MNQESNNSPLVSVLMTAYNRETYIAEAIESVLASTYKNFELIIVDDCSQDETVSIANNYAAKDQRIKVFVNENNLGQFSNRNKAADYAKGKYIKYFDSDDIMKSHCLSTMVSSMNQFPEAAAGAELNETETLKNTPAVFNPRELYLNHYQFGFSLLYKGPSASIFKRDIFLEMGKFNEQIGILSDTLLMLKIAAKYKIVGIESGLFYWRRHNEQVTIGQDNWVEMAVQRFKINEISFEEKGDFLSKKEWKILKRNMSSILARNILRKVWSGDLKSAREVISKSGLGSKDFFLAILPNKKIKNKEQFLHPAVD